MPPLRAKDGKVRIPLRARQELLTNLPLPLESIPLPGALRMLPDKPCCELRLDSRCHNP